MARICADDLNDDVLGRCLDALFEADVSALCQVMAAQVVERLGLKAPQCTSILPASTSMAPMTVPMGIWSVLQLVRGYSRDHRPELNQVILAHL